MWLKDFPATYYSVNRKSGLWGNRGHELLSLPNTTFSPRGNSHRHPPALSMGKAFLSTSWPWKSCLSCQKKKKKIEGDLAKLWSESLNGLGNQVGHWTVPYSLSAWHFISAADHRTETTEGCHTLGTGKLEPGALHAEPRTQWHSPDSALRRPAWPSHILCPWLQWLCSLISQHAWMRVARALS